MRSMQILFLTLLGAVFVVAGLLTWHSWSQLSADVDKPKDVPAGSQEIAWLASSTSHETWHRIVQAAEYLERQWDLDPKVPFRLHVQTDNAYPMLTAGVPEIVFWVDGNEKEKIYLRWYKDGGKQSVQAWIDKLVARKPPPLAILGGQSSRQAIWISEALRDLRRRQTNAAPVFLITTATAVAYETSKHNGQPGNYTDPDAPQLMNVYNHSYRFSFTNELMARGVLDFVQEHPELWRPRSFDVNVASALVAGGNPWLSATLLQAETNTLDYAMHAVKWDGDQYSADLTGRFLKNFTVRFPRPETQNAEWPMFPPDSSKQVVYKRSSSNTIERRVGEPRWDPLQPTQTERLAAVNYLQDTERSPRIRQLLVLSTQTLRANRYLRALKNVSSKLLENIVVINGDSISFNDVYRDRRWKWNTEDLPVSLVFFCHRNPVDKNVGFREEAADTEPRDVAETEEKLFYRDLLEAVFLAGWPRQKLVTNADMFERELRTLFWQAGRVTRQSTKLSLFDEERNRNPGTGEHIVCIRRVRHPNRHDLTVSISVWASHRRTSAQPTRWHEVRRLNKVSYLPIGSSNFQAPEAYLNGR